MLGLIRALWHMIAGCARRRLDEEIDREIRTYNQQHLMPQSPPIQITLNIGRLVRHPASSNLIAMQEIEYPRAPQNSPRLHRKGS